MSTKLVPAIKTWTMRRNVFIRGIHKTGALEQQKRVSSLALFALIFPSEESSGKLEAEKYEEEKP